MSLCLAAALFFLLAAWFWIQLFLYALLCFVGFFPSDHRSWRCSIWLEPFWCVSSLIRKNLKRCVLCNLPCLISKSPQQTGLPLCHLRNGLTVGQTSLFGMFLLFGGKSIAENLSWSLGWIGLVMSPASCNGFNPFLWVILLLDPSFSLVFGAFGDLLIPLAMSLFR